MKYWCYEDIFCYFLYSMNVYEITKIIFSVRCQGSGEVTVWQDFRTCITKLLNNEILMLGRFFVIFIFDERVFIQWKMKSRRYVFLSSVLVGIIWCSVCGSFKFVDWTSCTVSVLFLELFMVYCVWDMNIIPCIPQFKSSKRLYVVG